VDINIALQRNVYMKNLILLALFIFGGMQLWAKLGISTQPIYDEPYVAVYGRDSCSYTRKMVSDLKSSDVNYRYFSIDDRDVADGLHSRMNAAGLSTRRYNLPVVDTNGAFDVRPQFEDVYEKYQAGL